MRLKPGHGPITPQTEQSNAILCAVELELGRSGGRKFFDIAVKAPTTIPGHQGARSS